MMYVIIFLFLCFYADLIYINFLTKATVIKFSNIKFKTGDLIFCKWRGEVLLDNYKNINIYPNHISEGFKNTIVGFIKGFKYTHCGVVIVINNIPFLYEVTNSDSYSYERYDPILKRIILNKPSLYPLEKCVKHYKGHMWYVPYKGNKLNKNKVMKFIYNKKNETFGGKLNIIKNYITGKTTSHNCASLVNDFLFKMKLIKSPTTGRTTPNSIYKKVMNSHYIDNNTIIKNYWVKYIR